MKFGKLLFFEKTVITDFEKKIEEPLLIRWTLFECPAFGVMVHKLCRSDHDRALHDHPWPFISIVLANGYTEEHEYEPVVPLFNFFGEPMQSRETLKHRMGSILVRPATWKHRVMITGKPAWTLVFKGPRIRKWGFWLRDGWCWWKTYNPTKGICESEPIWEGNRD